MDSIEAKEYTERADDIEEEDLERWTVESEFYDRVQKKILQKGAKLIVGPRGTGKTHQMRIAYGRCLKSQKAPMPIYVSVGKYFHLEPFLHKTPIAATIFHTWILCKILKGCYELVDHLRSDHEIDGPLPKAEIEEFISQAEKHSTIVKESEAIKKVTIDSVISVIGDLLDKFERKRCILLLDDAALNLTPEYLIEFFDVFRSLKTIHISPKASIYPTTDTGPRFHVKHDAESVPAWQCVDDDKYGLFMDKLIQKRLAPVNDKIPDGIIDLLKYAAFGIPRAFINLVRSYEENDSTRPQQKFNEVINEQGKAIEQEYMSLDKKMPQYKTIIKTGFELFEAMVEAISQENKRFTNEKQFYMGLSQENKPKFEKMMNFLIDAGLLYEAKSPQRHGEGRIYDKYIPHLLFLIKNRAFSIGRGFNVDQTIDFLKRKSTKHFVRRNYSSLLSEEKIGNIKLDLPPCGSCNTLRLAEQQKFCHNCGKELVEKSAYKRCMSIPVNELPISDFQKKSILEYTSIKIVEDFFIKQDIGAELQKAHRIGRRRSAQIYDKIKSIVEKAKSYVEEEYFV